MQQKQSSRSAQIRNLIVVIGGGMLAALLIAYFMVTNYGPTGQYQTNNILLEPSFVQNISFQEQDPQTGKNSRYTFDRIEWLHFDSASNRWISSKLDENTYSKIYDLLRKDNSIVRVTPETKNLFYTTTPTSVTIVVHAENHENTKVLQEIQFADHGDFYRVLLREDAPSQNWIYFFHPKVFEQVNQQIHP